MGRNVDPCAGLIGINMANAPHRLLLFSSLVFFLPEQSQVAVLPSPYSVENVWVKSEMICSDIFFLWKNTAVSHFLSPLFLEKFLRTRFARRTPHRD